MTTEKKSETPRYEGQAWSQHVCALFFISLYLSHLSLSLSPFLKHTLGSHFLALCPARQNSLEKSHRFISIFVENEVSCTPINFVDLKFNSALISNKSHNLLESVFPSNNHVSLLKLLLPTSFVRREKQGICIKRPG